MWEKPRINFPPTYLQDGKLALIDFGLCAEVPLPDTRVMTLSLVHLMQGDVRGLIDDAIELGFLPRVRKDILWGNYCIQIYFFRLRFQDVNVDKLYPDLKRVYDSGQVS